MQLEQRKALPGAAEWPFPAQAPLPAERQGWALSPRKSCCRNRVFVRCGWGDLVQCGAGGSFLPTVFLVLRWCSCVFVLKKLVTASCRPAVRVPARVSVPDPGGTRVRPTWDCVCGRPHSANKDRPRVLHWRRETSGPGPGLPHTLCSVLFASALDLLPLLAALMAESPVSVYSTRRGDCVFLLCHSVTSCALQGALIISVTVACQKSVLLGAALWEGKRSS